MALDLYAGPVSRYLRGDWKNLGQQAAEAMGLSYQVVGGRPQPSGLIGRWRADRAYSAWQSSLARQLGELWDDSPDRPYATHRPGWEGFSAMLVVFAHREVPGFPVPSGPVSPDALDSDPAMAAFSEQSHALSILGGCRAWLPGTFANPISVPLISGEPVKLGSVRALNLVLDRACEAWPVSRSELEQMPGDQPAPETPWEDAGLYGLSTFCQMATYAAAHSLPMLLDY